MTKYWKDVFERAVKTAAGAAMTALGGNSINFLHLDYSQVLGVVAGATVFSLLGSLASRGFGSTDTASLVAVDDGSTGRHATGA